MKQITSIHNLFIKSLLQLQEKSRSRRNTGTFLMEGRREIKFAIDAGYEIESILFDPEIISMDEIPDSDAEPVEISREVFQKLAYRDSTEGIIAIAKSKDHGLASLRLRENPLILIAEAPEKPGNIGALLRTADAANLDAVIIANPKTDLYNPNIIRSSVGCIFTVPIAMASTSEIISFLNAANISIYCATLQNSVAYHEQDFRKPSAIVVGTESIGLSDEWRKAATMNIIIPMQGAIDSMNVSVAAAILVFEAKRQRNFDQ